MDSFKIYIRLFFTVVVVSAAAFLLSCCGSSRKISHLEHNSVSAKLALSKESDVPELEYRAARRDTLVVRDDDGRETLIMKAVRDDETGEMVASDVIDAAMVTARFRNVAERHGKVDLMFQVIVPEDMMDSEWQLRFDPDMFIMQDSVRLDPVIITGAGYRKAQLRGYQQYERFLSRIVSDTTKFINIWQLELFLERNLPEVFAFKTDSTEVSDELFFSYFGVTEEEAVQHYTNKFARYMNERRKSRIGKMYRRYVKAPIVTEGIRLDTVIRSVNGDFIYNYVQTINTRPKLRRVDIVLSGSIYEQDRKIYTIPRSEPLTFYISSISSFADGRERYLTKVVERSVSANTTCRIAFAVGRSDIDESLADNAVEMDHIRLNLAGLMDNEEFDLDSIVVTASSSPEGSFQYNSRLSDRRSDAVSRYFSRWMRHYQDSLESARGFSVDESGNVRREKRVRIPFKIGSLPENWPVLDGLISSDPVLTDADREHYRSLSSLPEDRREQEMRAGGYYGYVRDSLYPLLRTVRFDFHLHRRGMVKDTVHTTVLDTVYMSGVQALRDMDYETALLRLGPYGDYNAAVAMVALDRNVSALSILESEEKTAQVNYMLALVYARLGRERDAVECYLRSCRQNPQYVHRGNLDPEISALIKLYGLNRQEEDDFLY